MEEAPRSGDVAREGPRGPRCYELTVRSPVCAVPLAASTDTVADGLSGASADVSVGAQLAGCAAAAGCLPGPPDARYHRADSISDKPPSREEPREESSSTAHHGDQVESTMVVIGVRATSHGPSRDEIERLSFSPRLPTRQAGDAHTGSTTTEEVSPRSRSCGSASTWRPLNAQRLCSLDPPTSGTQLTCPATSSA